MSLGPNKFDLGKFEGFDTAYDHFDTGMHSHRALIKSSDREVLEAIDMYLALIHGAIAYDNIFQLHSAHWVCVGIDELPEPRRPNCSAS